MPLRALGQRLNDLPYLLLALSPLFWAGNMIVGRAVRGEVPPFSLNLGRWLIASAILLVIVRGDLWRQRHLLRRHWKLILVLGGSGIAAFHSFVYVGLQDTTALNASLIVALGPALILPAAWLLLGERMTWLQGLGVLLSFVGVAVIITRADLEILLHLKLNRGDLWLLAASGLWGLYSVVVKLRPPELKPLVMLVAAMLLGALLVMPLVIWEVARGDVLRVTPSSIGALAYCGIFAGVLGYMAWNRGIEAAGPNRGGLFLHLIPVYGALLAWLFLGEALRAFHLYGVVFIAAGIALTSLTGRPGRPSARP